MIYVYDFKPPTETKRRCDKCNKPLGEQIEMSEIIKIEYPDRVEYRLHGQYHREDGPAVEFDNGSKYWYLHGEFHREDGPAIELANGDKFWYLHGERHREDGPAKEWANGRKEYWINGKRLDFITSDQMLIYYLKYGFLK